MTQHSRRRRPTFAEVERLRAEAWKRSTGTLPDEARSPAQYIGKDGVAGGPMLDYCLPPAHAPLSLLHPPRHEVLELFTELGIPWHAGVGDGPSNHLLSSQVQCVNALGQMVSDPDRLRLAFADSLHTAEVLEVEPGRFLTFEFIGPIDYFGESPGAPRIRGAHCTSADAAFLHRTVDDVIELVLVEWKYTESYRRRSPSPGADATRRKRYGDALAAGDGPVRSDVLEFADLLQEPFYQLMRQQLLAHELEKSHACGAESVRVVHVSPPGNIAYQQSLTEAHRALGDSVSEVWSKLLRRPEKFVSMDSSVFRNPDVTSQEYDWRYGDHLVLDKAEALRLCGGNIEDHLRAALDYDGAVSACDHGVELIVGTRGTVLQYPFSLPELYDLARKVEDE